MTTTNSHYGTNPQYRPFEAREEYLPGLWAVDERSRAWAPSGEADAADLNGRPISNRGLDTFERPFPALTPAQRLHMDLYGYVVIENLLSPGEVEQLCSDMYDLEQRSLAGEDFDALLPAFRKYQRDDHFHITNLDHVRPSFFDYVTHPRIVGMAEEAIGGPARPYQSAFAIRRQPTDKEHQELYSGFHRGSNGLSGTIANGLYHFPLVNALTNLTDLGPDDGGTVVIAGSHKLPGDLDMQAVIDGAIADPSLLHHVQAPAGSTLLFYESLIHSSGIIRTGRDRLLMMSWYAPHFYAPMVGDEPAAALVRQLPEEYRRFYTGFYAGNWVNPALKTRSLTEHPQA